MYARSAPITLPVNLHQAVSRKQINTSNHNSSFLNPAYLESLTGGVRNISEPTLPGFSGQATHGGLF